MKTQQVHLIRRPVGQVCVDDFVVREVELPVLNKGQVLVENLYMSVDPYMRRSMEEDGKDLVPWPINGPLNGPSIGRVLESRHSSYSPGDIVESMSGWQQHFVSNAEHFIPYMSSDDALAKRTLKLGIYPKDFLSLLGISSQTAYFALTCAASPQPGETLVVSSGAGTVGSLACQIGKLKGLRVVTSAGSDNKVEWLRDTLGVDFSFNYKTWPISEALREACPQGIDLVLENASPEHLSACLPLMNPGKLALISGFISIYDTGGRVENFKNFEYILDHFLTVKGYAFTDYLDAYEQFVTDMLAWRHQGQLDIRETVFEGLEQAPAALLSLFEGTSFGKTLVRLAV